MRPRVADLCEHWVRRLTFSRAPVANMPMVGWCAIATTTSVGGMRRARTIFQQRDEERERPLQTEGTPGGDQRTFVGGELVHDLSRLDVVCVHFLIL